MNKALFLDRDGVINFDSGYSCEIENFKFIPGIFSLAKEAQKKSYLIFIITNQSGIARGFYSEEKFLELTQWIENEFQKNGIKITKTYFCPFHTDAKISKYKKDSFDRKPAPGMILTAAEEFNLDLKNSVLIGDKSSDIEAGKNAGITKNILFADQKHSLKNYEKIL